MRPVAVEDEEHVGDRVAGDVPAVCAVDADVPVEGVSAARSHGRCQCRRYARPSGDFLGFLSPFFGGKLIGDVRVMLEVF